ncbi:hypothetical protein F2Q69_00025625 [Brassica cretica]|uniref:Uncharacterized protein n=1 Tax=Brassica cretica TaxID=69181 RepID=A0A8S9S564_BRACR|nr:hypothetical protein F2Q69_00025625 [Brassica cretica]
MLWHAGLSPYLEIHFKYYLCAVLPLGARVAAAAGEEEKKAWANVSLIFVHDRLWLLGSEANLIVCEQARSAVSHGYTLTFNKHFKFGLPSTLILTAIGLLLIK